MAAQRPLTQLEQNIGAAPTTFANLAPTAWTDKFRNAFGQAKTFGTLSTALQDGERGPNLLGNHPSITIEEANKRYGISIPGQPNELVDEEWAKRQAARKYDADAYSQLAAGSETGFMTNLLGGVAANILDPAEIALNIGVMGATAGVGSALSLGKAGTFAYRTGKAIQAGSLATSVSTDVAAGLISAGTQYAAAQQTDPTIFGEDGYTMEMVAQDVIAGAAVGAALDVGIRGVGKYLQSRKLKRVVSPALAQAELAKATAEGRPVNPANTINIPDITEKINVATTNIREELARFKAIEDAIPRKNVVDVETNEYPTRYVAESFDKPEQLLPTLPDATKPRLPKGALKKKAKIEDGGVFNLPLQSDFVETSQFGRRGSRQHRGIDLAAPTGTPINSAKSGTVTQVGFQENGAGNYVVVDHGNGYKTKYFHMDKVLVKRGAKVTNKTQLGTVGSTGRSTGPHLHYEVWKGNKAVDPKGYLRKGAKEIPPVASEAIEPAQVVDSPVTNRSAFDEVATKATTMQEAVDMGEQAASNLLDNIGDVTTNTEYTPPRIVRAQYEELVDELEILAGYTNGVVDREAAIDAFARGGVKAKELITAVEQMSPETARSAVVSVLENARVRLKEDIRVAAGAGTKGQAATQKAYQLAVAEELPVVLAAHRMIQEVDPKWVTEELPTRYLLETVGADVSEFGSILLKEVDPNNNLPLYRVRQHAFENFSREADEMTRFLESVKDSQGAPPPPSTFDLYDREINKRVEAALKEVPADDYASVVETSLAVLDERMGEYMRTGIFDETKLKRFATLSSDLKAAINRGEYDFMRKGGDVEKGLATRTAREKAYTEALKRVEVMDVLAVCTARGLGRGE